MARAERDTWLYGTKREWKKVAKAAKEAKGLLEASPDSTFRALTEDPRERQREARIVNWGGARKDSTVSVVKAAASQDDPEVASRQLRDPFTTFYVQGIALEPPLPPDRLLNLTEENALHSACLDAVAADACGRGWSFAPREGKETDQQLIESPEPEKLKGLMEDLTPELTFTELLYQAAWEMRGIGWGVWEVVRKNNDGTPGKHGEIGAIYPIPAHTIRASLDPRKWVQIRAGRVRYFKRFGAECTINNETGDVMEWKGKGSKLADDLPQEYVASELIIFKTYTPRSLWYGLPKWISAIATIAELGAIREFNVSWFASGGQTDYHMHFKAGNIEMARDMKEQVEQQVREFAGRGHTNILTAGDPETDVSVNKLGETLREGHFRFRRGDLVKEVLIAHGVPPYRIGWAETGSLGGNAAPEMLGAYSVGVIKPVQNVIEDRLRQTLFDPKIGIKTGDFRLKLQALDLENLEQELQRANAGVESGTITPNQWREMNDLDVDEENDALNKYYYKGQELGKVVTPGQGGGFGSQRPDGGFGSFGGDGSQDGGDGGDGQGPQDEPKRKAALEARGIVVGMLREFETKVKAALVDSDPIDSEQPPVDKPRRGRGAAKPATLGGPARDDKPNVA